MDGSGGGQAENFFFTAADGTVQRRAQRLLRCVLCVLWGVEWANTIPSH